MNLSGAPTRGGWVWTRVCCYVKHLGRHRLPLLGSRVEERGSEAALNHRQRIGTFRPLRASGYVPSLLELPPPANSIFRSHQTEYIPEADMKTLLKNENIENGAFSDVGYYKVDSPDWRRIFGHLHHLFEAHCLQTHMMALVISTSIYSFLQKNKSDITSLRILPLFCRYAVQCWDESCRPSRGDGESFLAQIFLEKQARLYPHSSCTSHIWQYSRDLGIDESFLDFISGVHSQQKRLRALKYLLDLRN